MVRKRRIHYTETDKAVMWDRWQKGESLEKIAQLFDRSHGDRSHGSVARILRQTGGIRPPKRARSRHALSLAEREEISRGVVTGRSLRSIATSLNRAPSTISREIKRNGGRQQYRANVADQAAWDRAHRPKTCKLTRNPALARIVASKLQLEWSPRQIAGWLKRTYPIQARGALKKELLQHLRRTRRMRRSRHHTHKTADRGQITDVVSIRERPAEAEDRAVPGHWEGDLLFGSKNSQIATLVERHSRYLLLARVKSKDTETVINALIKQAHKLPRELYKSLTWDRGKEMADHKRFTLDTNIQVYFCDPKSPWQRGLLRQYFPKGMDLSNVHQNRLNAVARRLNERPRETLNFETPAERFNQCVASTG
jgi:IS30 family transposase